MESSFNKQLNREMYSAYLYLSMSNYCNENGMKGFSRWFMVQYHEEMYHALKMYEFIQQRGGKVRLNTIAAPESMWKSSLDVFEKTLEHEEAVTQWINELMDVAIDEKDHASKIFIQWFISEQVEEEDNDRDIVSKLKLISNNPQGLFMLDKELGTRIATSPLDFSIGIEAAEKAKL